jgi:hypothetical protein
MPALVDRLSCRAAAAAVFTAVTGLLCIPSIARADGPIGTVQQPLINGDPVTIQQQQDFGLVTVGNRCSGTLVNRYWVLTADHCVSTNGKTAGLQDSLANLVITASWSPLAPVPTRVVRYAVPGAYGAYGGTDVALLYLGKGDFGAARIQLYYVQQVDTHVALMAYGRGIFAYATGLFPTATPAKGDGKYRSALFIPASAVPGTNYTFNVSPALQIIGGGDSGGPDIVFQNGVPLGIAGVHSLCHGVTWVKSMPGYFGSAPQNWNWVSSIHDCTSAALYNIRDDIVRRTQEHPTLAMKAATMPAGAFPRVHP